MDTPQTQLKDASGDNPPSVGTGPLRVVYPLDGHVTCEASTFVVGSVQGEGQLRLNGDLVHVSPKGFFSVHVPLKPGENKITLHWFQDPNVNIHHFITTLYQTAENTSQPKHLGAEHHVDKIKYTPLFLNHTVGVTPGEKIQVAVQASHDVRLAFHCPELLSEPLPLIPIDDEIHGFNENRTGIFAQLHQTHPSRSAKGWCVGTFTVPLEPKAALSDAYAFYLSLTDVRTNAVSEFPLNGKLEVYSKPCPAMVKTHRAVVRTLPISGQRLTALPRETRVLITGAREGWYRIQWGTQQTAWISEADVLAQPHHAYMVPVPVSMVHVEKISDYQTRISLPLAISCPFQITMYPTLVELNLIGTESVCDFIHYQNGAQKDLFVSVLPGQPGQTQVKILSQRGLFGYDYTTTYREGSHWIELTLTFQPRTKGELRVLIDPGHGGDESGALAPNGTPEKDMNLAVAHRLKTALLAKGFWVQLTRETDETVTLQQRGDIADAGTLPTLILSLHHNALPDGRNPLEARGWSTYYYHAFAYPWAQAIHQGMVQGTPQTAGGLQIPDYGILMDNLFMTRIHSGVAILLEAGFLTHPEEAELVLDEGYQQQWVNRLSDILSALF